MTVMHEGKEVNFEAAVELMDDYIREGVAYDLAPCTEQEFFDEYCRRHLERYEKEFDVS